MKILETFRKIGKEKFDKTNKETNYDKYKINLDPNDLPDMVYKKDKND